MQPPEQTPRQRIIELITAPAIVLPVGTDAGHSRATGRGASDPRREDHRTRQDKAVHLEPGTLSGL